MAHLRAVPDPDEPVDPAAAVAPGEDDAPATSDAAPQTPASEPAGPEADQEPRRYPSTIGGAFYLTILAAAGAALVVAARGDWRLGIEILGGSLIVAALLRLVLANRDAGMLAVRHRLVDVFLLTSAGVSLILMATSIPDSPAP